MNITEKDEKRYLETIIKKIKDSYTNIDMKIERISKEITEAKKYIWENISQLDLAEKSANRISVHNAIDYAEKAKKEKERLEIMIKSPYFGRIDFKTKKENFEEGVFYIGIHSFSENSGSENIIYDWRAPLSSMFYDFELGDAYYEAPFSIVEGKITKKRQYKIKKGSMEYMLESSLNIGDELLQKELSQSTDEKMKNIVATIQREQNEIIRDENANIMIIQGAAGSGKTSIAMHRIAFLLYRYRGKISSDDILIISPNKVYADYISDVLPELGEENIPELGFEDLAKNILGENIKMQTFSEQVEELLVIKNQDNIKRVNKKSTIDFLNKLNEYIKIVEKEFFEPIDIEYNGYIVTKEEIKSRYDLYKNIPVFNRMNKLKKDIIYKLKNKILEDDKKWITRDSKKIEKKIEQMHKLKNAFEIYEYFFDYYGYNDLYKKGEKLEYSDVFPLIYIKLNVEGIDNGYNYVRHLLVDEMQDYTPIHYAVIKKLFNCKITIMGDKNQNINPYSSTSIEKISFVFPEAKSMELNKSYRSTFEIAEFSKSINKNVKTSTVERHGEKVTVNEYHSIEEEIEGILKNIKEFREGKYNSFAILCKSQKEATNLYKRLKDIDESISLLSFNDNKFVDGIVITSIHMSKGLEFDKVLIPKVDERNYQTEMDRNLLYVACTRAMHKLDISCSGKISNFIE
ncbi:3'-5' exonuclease [Clostridium sp. AL.422]|uniref:HelD family protein n=1 Tax=Clostridium TaxID=1485 RepID=UPI00293DA66F|nr:MULTISPECIES: 3'-5' exonuclease [unclassified Clostridium]MDV4151312.1 3'-5' exonuclease [Clostridium sp. AL.422]